ncbi:MAG: HAD-IIA family hydrolase [Deltaproteobacteria bacterium]|nr:HAD-IIA family hydrolase [Deltaproteobacteria bacterium]
MTRAAEETTLTFLWEHYEVLLFDAYGVLLHSSGALPGAVELVERLNREKKPYYILTNDASRLPATAAAKYRSCGLSVPPERIITSGSLLEHFFQEHALAGKRCVVLGTPDSVRYAEDAGGNIVAPGEDLEVLVCADEAGVPSIDVLDAVLTSICRAIDGGRQVHLVLPNPDLIYPKGDGAYGFGAGSIARLFEGALGLRYPNRSDLAFAGLGKPGPGLFREALSRSGSRRMVMVGDQMETDIAGARAFGIDAAWIETGVSAGVPDDAPAGLGPTYRLRALG